MSRLTASFAGLARRESGQTMLEYVLIIALVSILLVVSLAALGTGISDLIDPVASQL